MALPTSGPLSFADVQTEFGGTNPIGMNEYYRGAFPTLVPDVRNATDTIPTSGAISLENFRGSKKATLKTRQWIIENTSTWTVPSDFVSLYYLDALIVGAGGQGAGWPSGAEGAGGGEGARLVMDTNYATQVLQAGQNYSVIIGAGGTGGPRVESGANGGNSSFGTGTVLEIIGRGGLGGIATYNASSRNLPQATNFSVTGLSKTYYLGGATTGRFGGPNTSSYGAGSGASNCGTAYYGPSGITTGGGSNQIPRIFTLDGSTINYTLGYGGYGCGGGDRRIANQGYWPGGGGGGADYNATGGNGAKGGVSIFLQYYGTVE